MYIQNIGFDMSKILKWGNSLALRIPYKVAQSLNLKEGLEITFEVKNETLIVKQESEATRKLLNLLNSSEDELDTEDYWGKPKGKEEW